MAIEHSNAFYEMLRHYMNFMFPMAYSSVRYVGLDKIPSDGAIIMAPNHTNALMDALTVLTVNNKPTVFVSRADIFRRPVVAKVLHFFKIMPIMRKRDGLSNLKKNDEIMNKAVEVLEAGVPFGIFSEGTHRMKHSLLPLTKGIFRIALQCNDALKGRKPVYIVPVGIEYGSYTSFRHSLLVTVGDALNVSEFVENHNDMEVPELINALREDLSGRMKGLFHYVPDNDYYDAILDLCYLRNRSILQHKNNDIYSVMLANRQTVHDVECWMANDGVYAQKIIDNMMEFSKLRHKFGIVDRSLYQWPTKCALFMKILTSIVVLPYMLYCFVVSFPALLIQWLATRNLEDMAFANSYRFVVFMLLVPLFLLILGILLFCLLPWYWAAFLFVLAVPAYMVIIDFIDLCKTMVSDYKLIKNDKIRLLWESTKDLIERI